MDTDEEVGKVAEPESLCEYCKKMVPSRALVAHQLHCKKKKKFGKVGYMLSTKNCLKALTHIAGREVTVDTIYDDGLQGVVEEIPVREPEHDLLTPEVLTRMEELAEKGGARTARRYDKHFQQESALCSAIARMIKDRDPDIWQRAVETGDARQEICMIDAGAAAGELLHLFQAFFRTTIALIEYYKPVRMVDHLYADDTDNFKRIWKDVNDVGEEDLTPVRRRVNIVVAKHLCGDGMCATITRVVDTWRTFFPVSQLVIAPCCQQLSTWEKYCGRDHFEQLGFDKKLFEVIRTKTGWKSLGHRDSRSRHRHLHEVATVLETAWHQGRLNYLTRHGAKNLKIFQYVREEVAIKNVGITCEFETAGTPS